MSKTKVKILVSPQYYRSYFEPNIDEYKPVWPTPLWKMRDEWWYKQPKVRKDGPAGSSQFFRRTFAACPSTKNWVDKTIAFGMPEDIEILPNLETDELEVYPLPEQIKGWAMEQHPDSQMNAYTNQHMNFKFLLPYEIVTDQVTMFGPAHLHRVHFSYPFTTMQGFLKPFHSVPAFCNTLIDVPKLVEDFKKTGKSHVILAGSPIMYVTFPTIKGKVDVKFEEKKTQNMGYWATTRKLFRLE